MLLCFCFVLVWWQHRWDSGNERLSQHTCFLLVWRTRASFSDICFAAFDLWSSLPIMCISLCFAFLLFIICLTFVIVCLSYMGIFGNLFYCCIFFIVCLTAYNFAKFPFGRKYCIANNFGWLFSRLLPFTCLSLLSFSVVGIRTKK